MDISRLLSSPLLGLVSHLAPQAAPIINFLQAHQDVIAKATPVVQAAINEGRPAFEAALKQAPQFANAVKGFLQQHDIPGSPPGVPANPVTLENVARMLAGSHKMSPTEEQQMMDRASPLGQSDSRQGSG